MLYNVSEERLHKFIDMSKKYFSWDIILGNAGISDVADKGDQYEISCILHDDKRPSLRLDKRAGIYHCFSCGASGSYVKFMWELEGRHLPFANFCDQILKSNYSMQKELGFDTIFVTEKVVENSFTGRRLFNPKAHIGSEMPITVLARKVRDKSDTWGALVMSLTLLQSGLDASNVMSMIDKQYAVVDQVERISLMDII